MKKKTIILSGIIVMVVLGILAYNYIYQDHRNIDTEAPEFVLISEHLIDEFAKDVEASQKKYLNKVLKISGKTTEVSNSTIVIDGSIFCQFRDKISDKAKDNTTLSIKGRCIGYDDLLEEIKLDQCSIVE